MMIPIITTKTLAVILSFLQKQNVQNTDTTPSSVALAQRINTIVNPKQNKEKEITIIINEHKNNNGGKIDPNWLASQLTKQLGITNDETHSQLLDFLVKSVPPGKIKGTGSIKIERVVNLSTDGEENKLHGESKNVTRVSNIKLIPSFIHRAEGVTDEDILTVYNAYLRLPFGVRKSFESQGYTLRIVTDMNQLPDSKYFTEKELRSLGIFRGKNTTLYKYFAVRVRDNEGIAHTVRHEFGHFVNEQMRDFQDLKKGGYLISDIKPFVNAWWHNDLEAIFQKRVNISSQERELMHQFIDSRNGRGDEIFAEVFASLTGPPTKHNKRITELFPASTQYIRTNILPQLQPQVEPISP